MSEQNDIVSLPYDVFSRASALREVEGKPDHFLRIDKPQINLEKRSSSMKIAAKLYKRNLKNHYHKEVVPSLYRYDLISETHQQIGLVALCSLDDLFERKIRDHEETRKDKELERTRHIKALNAQTGPIYLFHNNQSEFRQYLEAATSALLLEFNQNGVVHRIYALQDPERVEHLIHMASEIDHLYVADGHHRMNAARNVYLNRKKHNLAINNSDYFLAVIFAAEELRIFDYNRVVKDLNGLSAEEVLMQISEVCEKIEQSEQILKPSTKQEFTVYLDNMWFRYRFRIETLKSLRQDEHLDVALLQRLILNPILNIKHPRTDERIDFIGGVFGLQTIVERCQFDMRIGFALYPTAIEDLMTLSDLGMKMPPKSTWFEPKLLSGIWLCDLDE